VGESNDDYLRGKAMMIAVPRSAADDPGYRWVILGVCWLAYIVTFMQRLSIGPLAPFLKEDLGLSSAEVGLFMSAAAFGYMLILIPAGWFVDTYGPRLSLLVGEIVAGIFISGMFTVDSLPRGMFFMAMAGIGMGCVSPATTKAVVLWFPLRERAMAMGLKQTAVNIGGLVTAATLPILAISFGWNFGFLIIGMIAVTIGITSFVLYKDLPSEAISPDASRPARPPAPRTPLLEILKTRDLWMVAGTGFFVASVQFSTMAYYVLFLKEELHFAVVTAGFFLAALEAGGAFGKPLSGVMSDRIFHGSRKKVYALMNTVSCAGCLVFAFLQPDTPSWVIIPIAVIHGFCAIGWGGLSLTLMAEFAGKEAAGRAASISSMFVLGGNLLGPPLFGLIVDNTGSYRPAWKFLAVMAFVATMLILFVREEKRRWV